jgi:hypothetical protein
MKEEFIVLFRYWSRLVMLARRGFPRYLTVDVILLPGAYERKSQVYHATASLINSTDMRFVSMRVCSRILVISARVRQEAVRK